MTKKTIKAKVTSIIPASEAQEIRKTADLVVKQASSLTIVKSSDEDEAYEVLQRIAERKKFIEAKRTAITKPMNVAVKAANAMFKELSSPLLEADRMIRGKIVAFHERREAQAAHKQARLDEQAAEAEEKAEAAHAKGDEKAAAKFEEKAFAAEEKSLAVAPKVGKSQVQKRWVFDVIDEDKVPREYLYLNSAAVTIAIRDGEREIAGLKIYQKTGLRVV